MFYFEIILIFLASVISAKTVSQIVWGARGKHVKAIAGGGNHFNRKSFRGA